MRTLLTIWLFFASSWAMADDRQKLRSFIDRISTLDPGVNLQVAVETAKIDIQHPSVAHLIPGAVQQMQSFVGSSARFLRSSDGIFVAFILHHWGKLEPKQELELARLYEVEASREFFQGKVMPTVAGIFKEIPKLQNETVVLIGRQTQNTKLHARLFGTELLFSLIEKDRKIVDILKKEGIWKELGASIATMISKFSERAKNGRGLPGRLQNASFLDQARAIDAQFRKIEGLEVWVAEDAEVPSDLERIFMLALASHQAAMRTASLREIARLASVSPRLQRDIELLSLGAGEEARLAKDILASPACHTRVSESAN